MSQAVFSFKITFFIVSQRFQFPSKIGGRYKDIPHASCPHTCIASPISDIPHQNGIFVTTDELSLTHHNHPKSTVSDLLLGGVHPLSLEKCMTCISHYSITQSIFTALKSSVLHLFMPPSQPLEPLILYSFAISRMLYSWNLSVAFSNWLLLLRNFF